MVRSTGHIEHGTARRVIIVVAAFLFLAVMSGPDLRRCFGHPLGIPGVAFDYHAVVSGVDENAKAAGVRVGDRLDLAHTPPFERYAWVGLATADAGQRIQFPLLRGHRSYVATLTTAPESNDRINMVLLRFVVQLMVFALGTIVVLRRPSPATWGFFAVMFVGCSPVNISYTTGPHWWRTVALSFYWLLDVVPQYGAMFFALHLLHPGPLPRWRRIVEKITVGLVCLSSAVAVWHANMLLFAPVPDPAAGILYSILTAVPFIAAPIILIATYYESEPNVRQRLRWIIVGFGLSTICNAIDQVGTQGNLGIVQESYVLHSFLTAGEYVFVAAPVAYAVLKHHIIDVNVAISRATVYTTLSVLIVGAFALVDFFFSHALDEKSAGLIADVALALVLGFSFNTLHRRIDTFVDRILFRKRHRAEEYVTGVAAAMAYARSEEHVQAMLTVEPVRAFDLTGACILNNGVDGNEAIRTLAAYLQARRGAARLTDGEWDLSELVHENWIPAIAVPVFSHGTLDAVVLYGLHKDATALDAQEIALLERLGSSAGAALDRLEAETLRREIARLRGDAIPFDSLSVTES